MQAPIALIAELEEAIASGSSEKRVATLKRVTGLFLGEADRLNDQQISVFDDVLVRLIERIESKALVELSKSLAPISNAPIEVIRRLANDDDLMVAAPVLTEARRLAENDLIEIAKSKGQGHLLAISGRTSITEAVTDILVERGNGQVVHTLAANAGARFSELGFTSIVKSASQDESLAEKLALRIDLPIKVLRQLLAHATDLIRARLLAFASPEKRDQIQQVLASIANEVSRNAITPHDFRASESLVQQLNKNGKLNEQVLTQFIRNRKYEETTSVLALFCSAPVELIERLMKNIQPEGLLIACKSAKLSWSTARDILKMRFSHHTISEQELDEAKAVFLALSQATAQRTLRFMLVQETAKKAV
jgi:uncharacterized protein (DUF2336 family)